MKKKFHYKKRIPMTIAKASFNMIGFKRPVKQGKALKAARLALCYGASLDRAIKYSGLSLRRVKVVNKNLIRGTIFYPRRAGKSFFQGDSRQLPPFPHRKTSVDMFLGEKLVGTKVRSVPKMFNKMIDSDFKSLETRPAEHIIKQQEQHIYIAMGVANAHLGEYTPIRLERFNKR